MQKHNAIRAVVATSLCLVIATLPARAYQIDQERAEAKRVELVRLSKAIELSEANRVDRINKAYIETKIKKQNAANQKLMLSDSELIEILESVGFEGNGLKMAWAVAKLESNGRPYAHNNNEQTGDNSYGIFQINMHESMGPARREKYNLSSNKDLFDPKINALIAFKMSNGGKSWGAWTVHEKARSLANQFPG